MEQEARYDCVAVVPAAGSGSRLHSITEGGSKLFLRLDTPDGEQSILSISIANLLKSNLFSKVVVACSEENLSECKSELSKFGDRVQFVFGGKTRQQSVYNALEYLADSDVTHVAIHDAARPFVSVEALREVVSAGLETGSALLVEKVHSTLKRVSEKNEVLETYPRREFTLAQTPQVFDFDLILNAHREVNLGEEATDDCQLVEFLGIKPLAVVNRSPNPKITEPADLELARILAMR